MFAIKQAVSVLVLPATMALLLVAASGVMALWGRARAARNFLISGALTAYLGSIPLVGNLLLRPLESAHAASPAFVATASPEFVVVLGSSFRPLTGVPITAAIDREGLTRIVEGIRLVRSLPGATLVVSGGAPNGAAASARGYAELALELGIDPAALLVFDTPLDTEDEARAVAAELGSAPFLLVTAAYHMPRAMRRMEEAGANAIPAPTGHLVSRRISWRDFLPTSSGMVRSELAIHEYVGLFALELGID